MVVSNNGKDFRMLKENVLQQFVSIVGPERCKTTKEDLLTYAYDAYAYEFLPDAVLFPKSSAEVSAIMQTASAHNVFVTPRGAGSGLGSEALAKQGGVAMLHHDESHTGNQQSEPLCSGRARCGHR